MAKPGRRTMRGNTHCEFVVPASQPGRATTRSSQQQRVRTRPPLSKTGNKRSRHGRQITPELADIRPDQDQPFALWAAFQLQDASNRISIGGVTAQAKAGFSCIRDDST